MKSQIILLHGALGSKTQLDVLKEKLTGFDRVHSFNFIGHGGEVVPDSILMTDLSDQLRRFIVDQIPQEDHLTIFGYSMGGYAALLLASQNNCRIDRIVTLGTKLIWNEEIALREMGMLNASVIEEKFPAFADELKQRHGSGNWKLILSKTSVMMHDLGSKKYLGDEVLSRIKVACKLMIGDKDKMVTLEETVSTFKKLKNSALSVLPATSHPIEKVDINRLIFEIEDTK